jgi:hypothetical protein
MERREAHSSASNASWPEELPILTRVTSVVSRGAVLTAKSYKMGASRAENANKGAKVVTAQGVVSRLALQRT